MAHDFGNQASLLQDGIELLELLVCEFAVIKFDIVFLVYQV